MFEKRGETRDMGGKRKGISGEPEGKERTSGV